MPGLVQAQLTGAGHLQVCEPAEARVDDAARERHALRLELGDGRLDVVAHEVELVTARRRARLLGGRGRVHPELRGRHLEDQPTAVSVDVREAEHVAEERSCRFGVVGVHDRVRAVDHPHTLPVDGGREQAQPVAPGDVTVDVPVLSIGEAGDHDGNVGPMESR